MSLTPIRSIIGSLKLPRILPESLEGAFWLWYLLSLIWRDLEDPPELLGELGGLFTGLTPPWLRLLISSCWGISTAAPLSTPLITVFVSSSSSWSPALPIAWAVTYALRASRFLRQGRIASWTMKTCSATGNDTIKWASAALVELRTSSNWEAFLTITSLSGLYFDSGVLLLGI